MPVPGKAGRGGRGEGRRRLQATLGNECGARSGKILLPGKRALGWQGRMAMPGGGCPDCQAVVLGGWAQGEEAGSELAVVVRSEGERGL